MWLGLGDWSCGCWVAVCWGLRAMLGGFSCGESVCITRALAMRYINTDGWKLCEQEVVKCSCGNDSLLGGLISLFATTLDQLSLPQPSI